MLVQKKLHVSDVLNEILTYQSLQSIDRRRLTHPRRRRAHAKLEVRHLPRTDLMKFKIHFPFIVIILFK